MIDYTVLVAYAFGLVLIYIIGRVFFMPIKFVLRLLYNGIIGGITLWLLNLVGGYFSLTIAINPVTALVVGFLGVPGIVLLIILKYVLS
jgi:inhibitor of the pro-sigma K processing machinery